jgi:hypothetical protein
MTETGIDVRMLVVHQDQWKSYMAIETFLSYKFNNTDKEAKEYSMELHLTNDNILKKYLKDAVAAESRPKDQRFYFGFESTQVKTEEKDTLALSKLVNVDVPTLTSPSGRPMMTSSWSPQNTSLNTSAASISTPTMISVN